MKKYLIGLAALLGIGIGGAVVAQISPRDIGTLQNGYIVEGNLVRSGNIIKTITMSNRGQNAYTCRQACDADGQCNAYTYQQTASNRKPECLLRLIALPNRARRNHGFKQAVSGTKVSFVNTVHKMSLTPGQAIIGGVTMRRFGVPNADPIACFDPCYRNNSCKGATYLPKGFPRGKGPSCVMYSKIAKLTSGTPRAGFLTATKGGTAKAGPTVKSPVLKPRAKPILRPRTQNPVIIQDKVPDGQQNDTPGGNDEFPGEMLDPENK